MGQNKYIADCHFFHANIIRYDNRPFSSVEEMNQQMINLWNSETQNDDNVYIVGDFSWGNTLQTLEVLKQLKGNKYLIIGNHDYFINDDEIRKQFVQIKDRKTVKDGKERIILDHHPSFFWDGQFRDSVHFYAHVHNSHQENMARSWLAEARQLQDIPMRAYNVGCMMPWINYIPRTAKYILTEAPKYLNIPAFGSEKHETIS